VLHFLKSCTLGSRRYFFLIDTDGSRRSRVNEEKITSGHRSTQPHFHVRNQFRIWTGSPIGNSHVKLFDVANQGHYCIVNSLRTWEYPIGDPVQILNWFLTWKWSCILLWPEVIFFLVNLALTRTISIDKKKFPLVPRVQVLYCA